MNQAGAVWTAAESNENRCALMDQPGFGEVVTEDFEQELECTDAAFRFQDVVACPSLGQQLVSYATAL